MRILILAALAFATPATAMAQCYMAREGSPYDFTASGGVLYENDFSGDALGDFPASLEFKQGSMEVARWNGRPALKASAPSAFVIPLAAPHPERFSVEEVLRTGIQLEGRRYRTDLRRFTGPCSARTKIRLTLPMPGSSARRS